MKIKKGKLNYDQSGRAYPPNPRVDENWSCIWEYEGKYYKLVGDNEHKEWDEVNIYNQIIDEVYGNYQKEVIRQRESQKKHVEKLRSQGKRLKVTRIELLSKDEFIDRCKTNPEFSEKWGLKIEERELSLEERIVIKNSKNIFISKGYIDDNGHLNDIGRLKLDKLIPTKLITLTYNDETLESYE